jgi:hypothetical protein
VSDVDDLDDLEHEFGPSLRVALRRIAAEITEHEPTTSASASARRLDTGSPKAPDGVTMSDREGSTGTGTARERRQPRLRALAIAAAAVVVVVAVIAVTLSPFDHDKPADKRADAVAESFMKAWVGGDGGAIAALLSPNGFFDGWTPATLPELPEWYQAMGWQYQDKGCEVMSSGRVWCDYTVENDLTRAFGKEPVTGSFVLIIDGGTVTSVRDDLNIGAYRDIWTAFSDWVKLHHAGDVDRMYTLAGGYARVDPISVALWKRYASEFVESGDAYVARARAICTAAHAKYDGLVAPGAPNEGSAPEAAAGVLAEALAQLQALPPPATVRGSFEVGFSLIDQLAEASRRLPVDAPPSSADDALRSPLAQIPHLEIGLERCAINPLRSS